MPLLISLGLVIWTFLQKDLGAATRTATALCMPLSLVWLGVLCFTVHSFRHGNIVSALGLAAVLVFFSASSMPIVGRYVTPLAEELDRGDLGNPGLDNPVKVAFVLGGSVGRNVLGEVEGGSDGERVISAAQLWHAGQTEFIVCTGKSPFGPADPAELGREMLISLGVPNEKIFEVEGRNTSSEAAEIDKWLKNPPASVGAVSDEQAVVITSAYHIPRARRLLAKQGRHLQELPVAFRTRIVEPLKAEDFIPSAGFMVTQSALLKEQLAAIAGR